MATLTSWWWSLSPYDGVGIFFCRKKDYWMWSSYTRRRSLNIWSTIIKCNHNHLDNNTQTSSLVRWFLLDMRWWTHHTSMKPLRENTTSIQEDTQTHSPHKGLEVIKSIWSYIWHNNSKCLHWGINILGRVWLSG